MSDRTFLVRYADDIAAVITSKNTEEAQRKLRRVMLTTKTWLDSHGLDLAMRETELLLELLFAGHRILLHLDMSIRNEVIRTNREYGWIPD